MRCTILTVLLFFVLPQALALVLAIFVFGCGAHLTATRSLNLPELVEFRSPSGKLFFAPPTQRARRVAYAVCGFYVLLLLLPALGVLWSSEREMSEVNAWLVGPILVFFGFLQLANIEIIRLNMKPET